MRSLVKRFPTIWRGAERPALFSAAVFSLNQCG